MTILSSFLNVIQKYAAFAFAILVAILTFGRVQRGKGRDEVKNEAKLEDLERANEIRKKSATDKPFTDDEIEFRD